MATNTSSIGTTGRDYSTIAAWEAATDNDLVTAGDIEKGEAYDDSNFSEAVTFGGATTDASNYRILVAARGEEYDPDTDTGCYNSVSSTSNVFRINEDYFRLQYFGAAQNSSSSSAVHCFRSDQDNVGIDGCFGLKDQGTPGFGGVFFRGGGDNLQITNCIARGGGGDAVGAAGGFHVNGGTGNAIYNCLAWEIDRNGSVGDGYRCNANTTITNCIATDSGDEDFNASGTQSYNTSADGTSTGTGSIDGADLTQECIWPASQDFRMSEIAEGYQNGTNLDSIFTTDFAGSSRPASPGAWNIGPFTGGVLELLGGGAGQTIAGGTTSSGQISGPASRIGNALASSSASGDIAARVSIEGSAAGVGSASGTLEGVGSIEGSADGAASASGTLVDANAGGTVVDITGDVTSGGELLIDTNYFNISNTGTVVAGDAAWEYLFEFNVAPVSFTVTAGQSDPEGGSTATRLVNNLLMNSTQRVFKQDIEQGLLPPEAIPSQTGNGNWYLFTGSLKLLQSGFGAGQRMRATISNTIAAGSTQAILDGPLGGSPSLQVTPSGLGDWQSLGDDWYRFRIWVQFAGYSGGVDTSNTLECRVEPFQQGESAGGSGSALVFDMHCYQILDDTDPTPTSAYGTLIGIEGDLGVGVSIAGSSASAEVLQIGQPNEVTNSWRGDSKVSRPVAMMGVASGVDRGAKAVARAVASQGRAATIVVGQGVDAGPLASQHR